MSHTPATADRAGRSAPAEQHVPQPGPVVRAEQLQPACLGGDGDGQPLHCAGVEGHGDGPAAAAGTSTKDSRLAIHLPKKMVENKCIGNKNVGNGLSSQHEVTKIKVCNVDIDSI